MVDLLSLLVSITFQGKTKTMLGLVLWCLSHLQPYYSYIVAVSFIDGGNRSTRRKPPIDLFQVTDKL
jgi:hypothetical protein